jgi:hypothetical protein
MAARGRRMEDENPGRPEKVRKDILDASAELVSNVIAAPAVDVADEHIFNSRFRYEVYKKVAELYARAPPATTPNISNKQTVV